MSGEATIAHINEAVVATGAQNPVPEEVVEISIPRDLAVTLVGSDAGKQKRIKPHSAMTKGASPEETAAVEDVMAGFLEQEIARIQNKPSGRPSPTYLGVVSIDEAKAVKAFCIRLADSLKQHLIDKGDDDRHYRSRQRLDQARGVISQINTALGLPPEDGRSPADRVQEIVGQTIRLRDKLCDLRGLLARQGATDPGAEVPSTPARELIEFLTPLNALLERVEAAGRS